MKQRAKDSRPDDTVDRIIIDLDRHLVSYEVGPSLVVEPELVLDMTVEPVDYTIN